MGTLAEQAVDQLTEISGSHEGHRAVHAKGTVLSGSFTATPEAAALTRAVHMQGEQVAVTARFSNGSGNPTIRDTAADARGLGVKFYLPDGSRADIVGINLPCFFVRTPEDFIGFTRASKPFVKDLPGPRLALFVLRHREALPALKAAAGFKPVPSYANVRYNSIHAFKWVDSAGGERHVRYSWLPQAGEQTMSGEEAKGRDRDFLQQEIAERMAREPVRFTLQLQLAADGDAVDDPTKAWPDSRERVTAGTLELTGIDNEREQEGDILVFDPTRVTDGIELTGDQILRFRSPAYSVSIERRSGAPRPSELA